MALDADSLLDRIYLKGQVAKWRNLAILMFVLAAIALFADSLDIKKGIRDYVARVEIAGVITDDMKREDLLHQLSVNDSVKAVIVRLDSPGGTAVGGEELYFRLKKIAEKKPVIAVMRNICTSACYMASLGSTRSFAREGTITGSIGVLVQTFEAVELAKKLGIEPLIIKSKPLKGSPNPLEQTTARQKNAVKSMIDDFYVYFSNLVKTERAMDKKALAAVTDGRTFSGAKAKELNLLDELGGERDAVEWLKDNYKTIYSGMEIRDVKPKRDKLSLFERLAEGAHALVGENFALTLDGLLAIWQPADYIK